MELIILPLILGIIAFFLPTNWVRPFGLLASLSVLAVSVVHLMNFDPANYVLILNPAEVFPLGLTFKMGYDGLALVMVLLTNTIISIILLANWNRDISSNALIPLSKVFSSLFWTRKFKVRLERSLFLLLMF